MGTHPIFESDFDCLTACQNSNRVKFCRAIPTRQMTTFQRKSQRARQSQPRRKRKRQPWKSQKRRKRKKGREKLKSQERKRGRSRSGQFHRCLNRILLRGRRRRSSARRRRSLQVVILNLQEELTCRT